MDRRCSKKAVGKTGRVAHQVQNRDRPCGRNALELAVALDADGHRGECRQVFGDRFREQEPPLLDQRHRCDRDDRLGHGIDAEDGVLAHGRPVGLERAHRLMKGDLAVAGDQHRHARRFPFLDLALHGRAQQLEPRRIEADAFGRRMGQGEGGHRGLLRLKEEAQHGA